MFSVVIYIFTNDCEGMDNNFDKCTTAFFLDTSELNGLKSVAHLTKLH